MISIRYCLLVAISFLLLITSCKKGCTDPSALNHNADAVKDNNTCKFVSDPWVGVYSVSDTVVDDQFIGTSSYITNYIMNVSRVNGNELMIHGLFKCTDTIVFNGEKEYFDIAAKTFCDRTLNAHFILTSTGLHFDSRFENQTSSMRRKGEAVKQ